MKAELEFFSLDIAPPLLLVHPLPPLLELKSGRSLQVANPTPRAELEQLSHSGEPVTGGRVWILTKCDGLQRMNVVDEVAPRWDLLKLGNLLDRGRDLRQPLFELPGGPRAMIEEVARFAVLVSDSSLVEIAIDCFEHRDAAGGLVDGEPLRWRERERLSELVRYLPRARLYQAGGVDALLDRIQIAGMRGDETVRVAVLVHGYSYRMGGV